MPGKDTNHSPPARESTPAEVFALVGHEIRAEIIWVFGGSDNSQPTLSFGELRSRLTTDVEPSQLHYHLQQLVGHFIEKTDDGYKLSASGIRLYLALRAGAFDRAQEYQSIDTDVDCYYCQAPIEANFTPIGVKIVCSECEHRYGRHFLDVPFAVFRDGAAALSHFRRYIALKSLFIARGVCPSCRHPLSPELYSGEDHPWEVCIHQLCDLCGAVWTIPVGRALLADLGLRSFCKDHGVDILSAPYWELEFAATDEHVTIRSTDPWEVALEVTFDGDTLELVVDGDLNVIERNRRNVSDDGNPSLLSSIKRFGRPMASEEATDEAVRADDEECLRFLRRQRWADEVTCLHCDSTDTIKKGTTSRDAQRYRCHTCDKIFNDLTGTIFAERRLSLPEMFYIVQAMDEEKTAAEIARQMDRSYQTVVKFVREAQDAIETEAESTDRTNGEPSTSP